MQILKREKLLKYSWINLKNLIQFYIILIMEIYIFSNHFKDQLNLTATNFSFRDYYQVVNQTKKT